MAAAGNPGDAVYRYAWDLPSRLALFTDTRRGQAEATAVDFVGRHALVKGLSDRRIQPLQQVREGLSVAPHEAGHERLIVDGDSRTFDGWHPSDADVATSLVQQFGDVRPLSGLYRVGHIASVRWGDISTQAALLTAAPCGDGNRTFQGNNSCIRLMG